MVAEGKPVRQRETPDADRSDEADTSPSAGNGALLRRARDLLLAHGEPLAAAELAGAVFGVAVGMVGAGPWLTLLENMLRASPVFARFDSADEDGTGANTNGEQRWGLAIWRQERRTLADMEFVVVDVETTGLAPGFHRITEVAAVVVAGGEQRAIFKSLINPERRIPQFITKFTGITERMVARASRAADVLPKLSLFIGDRPIVGHNIGFDLGFLSYEAERAALGTLFPADGIDTITLARRYLPNMRRASLDRVAAALHLPVRNRHRALADAQLTANVFALLLARARKAGCVTLEDLQFALHGGTSRRRASVAIGMFAPRAHLATSVQADTLDALDMSSVEAVETLADTQENAAADVDEDEQPAKPAARRSTGDGFTPPRPTGALYLNPAWRKDFSSSPGVYLMKDASGEVIYVGKAKCLRDRLASYYNQPLGYTRKMDGLLQSVREIETRELGSELEALIVESRLIKQLQPRYNVQLRNHEQYPFIKVDLKSAYPRFYATREVSADGARYFGPFRTGGIVHATIELLYKVFPIRNCTRALPPTGAASEPCLRYHLKRCPAPCRAPLTDEATREYHAAVQEACAFLGGERADLIDRLKGEMFAASARQDYERAARLRDALRDVDQVLLGQKLVTGAVEANNLLIAYPSAVEGYCELFLIRHGRLIRQERIPRDEAALTQTALMFVALAATLESPPPCVGREEVDQINIIARWISHHSDDDTRAFFRLPDDLRDPQAQAAFAAEVAHTVASN